MADKFKGQGQRPMSDYPDPEEAGLNLPWMDQYQPVAAERFSAFSTTPRPADTSRNPVNSLTGESGEDSDFDQSNLEEDDDSSSSEDELEASEDDMDMDEDDSLSSAGSPRLDQGGLPANVVSTAFPRTKRCSPNTWGGSRGAPSARAEPRAEAKDRAKATGRGRDQEERPARGRRRERGELSDGKNSRRGRKRGPQTPLEPSKEFTVLQKQAVDAFLDKRDFDRSLQLIQDAIAINPEVYAAHALLSEIYFAKGDEERGIAALFSGAHAAPKDNAVWQQVADACLQRESADRVQSLQQAAYCYARMIEIDKDDLDSHFQRAAINRELGLLTFAMREFDMILTQMPNNPSVIQQISAICLELGEFTKAKELYDNCIIKHQTEGLDGEVGFSWPDINSYIEIFCRQNQFAEAISQLKSLSRWLLGRDAETYWDSVVDDDREWDPADEPRRYENPLFVAGEYPTQSYGFGMPLEVRARLGICRLKQGRDHRHEALNHFEWLEPDDLEAGEKAQELKDIFREIADALRELKEFGEALRFYQPLQRLKAFSDTEFWLSVASAYYVNGQLKEAAECYESAKEINPVCSEARIQLAKLYKDLGRKNEALKNAQEALVIGRRALVKPGTRRYERKEAREAREAAENTLREAHKLMLPSVYSTTVKLRPIEVRYTPQKFGMRFVNADPARQSVIQERAAKRRKLQQMTKDEAFEYRINSIQSLYSRLQTMTQPMRDGDQYACKAWLECADELTHDFRSNKVFYPQERHVRFEGYDSDSKRKANRKRWTKEADATFGAIATDYLDTPPPSTSTTQQSTVPTSYGGLAFTIWLEIFLEMAHTLSKLGRTYQEAAYETIKAVIDCTIWYHDREAMLKTHVCYFTCALALGDGETLANVVSRWFMKEYQFVSDSYRLFAALNLIYAPPIQVGGRRSHVKNSPFRQGPCQKFLYRHIRAVDFFLPPSYNASNPDGPLPKRIREEESDSTDGKATLTSRDPLTNLPIGPKELDIVLLSIYGMILYTGASFPIALHYFYRAYALDPVNPMLLLTMALCHVHQAFKRQNENRHLYVMQGLAFFQEYADARRGKAMEGVGEERGDGDGNGNGKKVREAEREIRFNRARLWHMLNLTGLAVGDYFSALGSVADAKAKAKVKNGKEKQREKEDAPQEGGASPGGGEAKIEEEGFNREAAYALQTIYALSGDVEMALRITDRYLVI